MWLPSTCVDFVECLRNILAAGGLLVELKNYNRISNSSQRNLGGKWWRRSKLRRQSPRDAPGPDSLRKRERQAVALAAAVAVQHGAFSISFDFSLKRVKTLIYFNKPSGEVEELSEEDVETHTTQPAKRQDADKENAPATAPLSGEAGARAQPPKTQPANAAVEKSAWHTVQRRKSQPVKKADKNALSARGNGSAGSQRKPQHAKPSADALPKATGNPTRKLTDASQPSDIMSQPSSPGDYDDAMDAYSPGADSVPSDADLAADSVRPDFDVLYAYELWYDKDGRITGYHKETKADVGVSCGNRPPDCVCAAFMAMYPPGEGDCYPWVPEAAAAAANRRSHIGKPGW